MKFYEKYPQLKNKSFLANLLTNTAFSTMALEDQTVEKSKVREIVNGVLQELELKNNQFFCNQTR